MTDRDDPLADWSTHIEPLAPRPGAYEKSRRGARRRRRTKVLTTGVVTAALLGTL